MRAKYWYELSDCYLKQPLHFALPLSSLNLQKKTVNYYQKVLQVIVLMNLQVSKNQFNKMGKRVKALNYTIP